MNKFSVIKDDEVLVFCDSMFDALEHCSQCFKKEEMNNFEIHKHVITISYEEDGSFPECQKLKEWAIKNED